MPPGPRLLFDAHDVARLRAEVAAAEPAATLWTELLERAGALLAARLIPEAEADGPDTQHGDYGRPSGQVAEMGLCLGLAYHITGDPRFADGLRDALRHYGRYAKWHGRGLARNDPPWHAELNTARFCFGFAVGYDCVRDRLSADERAEIAGALVRLGIEPTMGDWVLPDARVHALDSMGHNWWSVCVSQAGLAALALLDEHPAAPGWVEAAAEGLEQWFGYRGNVLQNKSPNFDADGAFYESVNYANYALAEYLAFRLAYSRVVGAPTAIPALRRAGAFFCHTCYPTRDGLLTVNFGDANLRGDAGRTAAMLLLCGYDTPEVRWYANRARPVDPGLALLAGAQPREAGRPDALGRLACYGDIGWAVLRTSWEDDATLLGVKCGFSWNHAHADAGSFVLFHRGQPLIVDSGTCAYDRREYQGYYCQSRAHNVILYNGRGQSAEDIHRGVKHPGRLHDALELGDWRYLSADATGPMAAHLARNHRHFLWIDDVLLVLDEVRAHDPGRLEWLCHHAGSAEAAGGADIRVVAGGSTVVVRPLHPAGLEVARREGLADHRPEQRVPYLSFAPTSEAREAHFLTAFLLGEGGAGPVSGPDWIGARLDEVDVYFNLRADGRRMHRNSNLGIDGWETDAYLLAVQRGPAGLPRQWFLACGSYLRRDGRVLFDSLSKAYVAVRRREAGLEVRAAGQPRLRLRIGTDERPAGVTCNGRRVAAEWDPGRRLVSWRDRGAAGESW